MSVSLFQPWVALLRLRKGSITICVLPSLPLAIPRATFSRHNAPLSPFLDGPQEFRMLSLPVVQRPGEYPYLGRRSLGRQSSSHRLGDVGSRR
jgi:hypothetical protein